MKKTFSQETGITTWEMNKWWQKTLYVIGWISFVYMAAAFTIGFIIGIIAM